MGDVNAFLLPVLGEAQDKPDSKEKNLNSSSAAHQLRCQVSSNWNQRLGKFSFKGERSNIVAIMHLEEMLNRYSWVTFLMRGGTIMTYGWVYDWSRQKWGRKGIAPGDTHQVFASRLVATGSCLLWGCLQGTIQSLKLTDSHFFFFFKALFPF